MNKNSKKTEFHFLFLVAAACILLSLQYLGQENIYDDQVIYKYFGLAIFKGSVPYKDFFETKPPLIFFLNAVTWFSNYRLTWLIDAMLILLATLMFYSLCKKNNIVNPWMLPILFNLIIRNYLISFGIGMTREYTAAFLMIYFCMTYSKSIFKYYIQGILVSLTLWMQQDALITLLPLVFYALFIQKDENHCVLKRATSMIIGFLPLTALILLYFHWHRALSDLLTDTLIINLGLHQKFSPFISGFKQIKFAIHDGDLEMSFYTSLVLGVTGLLFSKNKRNKLVMSHILLFLSFIAEYLTGRLQHGSGYLHYLLPLSATIPILVFLVFSETDIPFLKLAQTQNLLMTLLSLTLFLGLLRHVSGTIFKATGSKTLFDLPEIKYLDQQKLSDFQLYVLDDTYFISLYNRYRILSPSRWNSHFFGDLNYDWDKKPELIQNIISDLKSNKTIYILDCTDSWSYKPSKLFYPQCKKFLMDHYRLLITDSSNRKLWRIQ